MYYLKKRMEVAGSHYLNLPYESKCKRTHGHNWIITVECSKEALDENGMIIDFVKIKEIINELDHRHLNDFIPVPTAEKIAEYLFHRIGFCDRVTVQESEGNIVWYTE